MAHPDESILHQLNETGVEAPRIRLRDTDDDGAAGEFPLRETGRYEFLGDIAEGGVGRIAVGRDVDLGRDVALKVLRDRHLGEPEILRRFVEEAQIGGQLQHPGIVPVYEMGMRDDERPFFAMKLVKGQTLTALLSSRKDPAEGQRKHLAIFEQICRTVAYAHARGVIHRDLKPSNVMVGAFGEVQVLDWGFAKVLPRGGVADERRARREKKDVTVVSTVRTSGDGSESIPGSIMGTPGYMPPEQALGQVDALDERTDVFSLGAVLAEILTGEPAYVGSSNERLVKAAKAELGEVRERLEGCGADRALIRLATTCLSPLRKDRPAHAGIVAEEVSAHLAAVEERAHRSELAATQARAKARRSREQATEQRRARRQTTVLAAAVLIAVMVAAAGWLWVDADRRAHVRETAEAVRAAIREATLLSGQGKLEEAALTAGRAATLARDADADRDLVARAEEIERSIANESARLADEEEHREKDRAMVATLERIRADRGLRGDVEQMDADLVTAFRDYGIDVIALEPAAAAERILASAIATRLVLALDEWAWIRTDRVKLLSGRSAEQILAVARKADPDPWRNRLRAAIGSGSLVDLVALSDGTNLDEVPVESLDMLGTLLCDANDQIRSVRILKRAWRRKPNDFWIHGHLTRSLAYQDFHEAPEIRGRRAIRHAWAAVAIRPDSAIAWKYLGQNIGFTKDLDTAERLLRKALEKKPDRAYTRDALAYVLWHSGQEEEALKHQREAVRLAPDVTVFQVNLAIRYILTEKWEEAEEELAAALKTDVHSVDANWQQAVLIEHTEGRKAALPAYRRTLEAIDRRTAANPDDLKAWQNALWIREFLERDSPAHEAAARNCVRLAPHASWFRLTLAKLLGRRWDVEEALHQVQEAKKHAPNDFWRMQCLVEEAGQYVNFERSEEAAPLFRAAERFGPLDPADNWFYGITLVRTGDVEEGAKRMRAAFPEAQGLPGDYHRALLAIADLHPDLEAIRTRTREPEDNEERIRFADLMYVTGHELEAVRYYRRALVIDPALASANRRDAAKAAVVAGDEELSPLDAAERAERRALALEWLNADLGMIRRQHTAGEIDETDVRARLLRLCYAARLGSVRGEKAIDRLPEAERTGWRKYWSDLGRLRDEVR